MWLLPSSNFVYIHTWGILSHTTISTVWLGGVGGERRFLYFDGKHSSCLQNTTVAVYVRVCVWCVCSSSVSNSWGKTVVVFRAHQGSRLSPTGIIFLHFFFWKTRILLCKKKWQLVCYNISRKSRPPFDFLSFSSCTHSQEDRKKKFFFHKKKSCIVTYRFTLLELARAK